MNLLMYTLVFLAEETNKIPRRDRILIILFVKTILMDLNKVMERFYQNMVIKYFIVLMIIMVYHQVQSINVGNKLIDTIVVMLLNKSLWIIFCNKNLIIDTFITSIFDMTISLAIQILFFI